MVRIPHRLTILGLTVSTMAASASGCAAASEESNTHPDWSAPAHTDEPAVNGTARPYRAPGEDMPILAGACEFVVPEFYPDEDMGSKFGPPNPPEGTGTDRAPAIRISLPDPSVAGRPYVIRAEVVHDSGLEEVSLGWATKMTPKWDYTCGGPKPPGVQVDCVQIGTTYIFVVVPPRGEHSFGISARAINGGSGGRSVATIFERCVE